MSKEHPLVELAHDLRVTAKSEFVKSAQQLDVSELSGLYETELRDAPRRHGSKKKYFVGHDGLPSTTKPTNRLEEHLALALWGAYHEEPLSTPHGNLLLLDYQVPLKASRSDEGVGKVDLIGILSQARLCVIELKMGGASKDTPLRATIEGLAYCAAIQANLLDITTEIHEKFGLRVQTESLELLVMAPIEYWNAFRGNQASEGWESAMQGLGARIKEATGVSVAYLQLDGFKFEVGHQGLKPALTKVGVCESAV